MQLNMSPIVISAMLQRVIAQVHIHNSGHLLPIIPWTLLCIDFLKVDLSRDGKENILVLTDAFTKFSQAFVTNNQKALTIAKVLVENGSMCMASQPIFTVTRAEVLRMP